MESVVPEKGVVDAAKSESLSRHRQELLFRVKGFGLVRGRKSQRVRDFNNSEKF